MTSPLHDVGCASLPRDELAALAEVRCEAGVTVALDGKRAWVRWQAGDERVLRLVLPVAGVRLYVERGGHWYRHGRHLPDFTFPEDLEYRPLAHVLVPAPAAIVRPPVVRPQPVLVRLVADQRPRTTTALVCGLAELERWADTVSSVRLATLRAACCQERVLLRGERLPLLPGGERYWGDRVLLPLGRRPEPELPESALAEALGIGVEELLLLKETGAEGVPCRALQPLTRAGLRLALQQGGPLLAPEGRPSLARGANPG
jgi:hypothetical protein